MNKRMKMDEQISRILDYVRRGPDTELTSEVSESVDKATASIDSLLETSQVAFVRGAHAAVKQYNAAWGSIGKSHAQFNVAFQIMGVCQKAWLAELFRYHASGKKKPKVALPELDTWDLIRLDNFGLRSSRSFQALSEEGLVYFASEAAKEMVGAVAVAKRNEKFLQNYRGMESQQKNGRDYSPAGVFGKALHLALRG